MIPTKNVTDWPNPGVHFGVSEADYHAVGANQGVLSKSLLASFARSPYKWKYGPPKDFSGNLNVLHGSLVDCLTLVPDAFHDIFALSEFESFRTNDAKVWRDKMLAEGLEPITQAQHAVGLTCAERLQDHGIAGEIIRGSEAQVSAIFAGHSEGFPYKLKIRPDMVPDVLGPYGEWLFDLKTTGSIADFPKIVENLKYHWQAAIYLDVYNRMEKSRWDAAFAEVDEKEPYHYRTRFGFIVQEREKPYEVAVFELNTADIAAGRNGYAAAIASFCECERNRNWPSDYEDEIKPLSRPGWARD